MTQPGRIAGPGGLLLLLAALNADAQPAVSRPDPPALPSLTLEGPYGSPLALAPRPRLALPAIDGVEVGPERDASSPAAVAGLPRAPGSGKPAAGGTPRWVEDEEDEEDATPTAPGKLGRERIKIPEPSSVQGRRARRSPTSITPDYEVPLGPKTSLGLFGEVGKMELERSGPIPSVKARDLNAGVTLQYRFGQ